MDLTQEQNVASYMREAVNETDWNKRIDDVKAANGGDYPSFWFRAVVLSGLADEVLGAGTSSLKIVKLDPATL